MKQLIILKNYKAHFVVFLMLIAVGAGFVIGVFFEKYNQPSVQKIISLENKETNKPAQINFDIFWDVWKKVEEKYVGRSALDAQKMVYGAINGMLESLDDPYNIFMPPQETKEFTQEIQNGEFFGIGIEIGMRKGILTVVAPLDGTPAAIAGLLAGDKILKIDDKMTDGMTLDEAVKLIRGQENTEVSLLINRNGFSKTKEIKIKRGKIKIPIITLSDKDGFAYIKFYQFTESSMLEFREAIYNVLNKPYRGVILDLRNNPGGYLEVSVDVASWFLEPNKVVAIEDFGNGKKQEYKSVGYNQLSKIPTVILVNQGSASASEILAGALRDHLNVKLIGEKTFGKGSVQELISLRNGSSLKLTIAKWLTPNGLSLTDNGLDPDIEVKMTEDDIENNKDPQLEKALEVIKKL